MARAAALSPHHQFLPLKSQDVNESFTRRFDSECRFGVFEPSSAHCYSTCPLITVQLSNSVVVQFLRRSIPMNPFSALSVSCGKCLSSTSLNAHRGYCGAKGFDRGFLTFTQCRKEAIDCRQQVARLGCGHTQLNFHRQSSSVSRIYSFGNGGQATDTSEEETETLEGDDEPLPTMEDIQEVAREQGLKIELRTLGPWFQINLTSADEKVIMGAAEGFETRWIEGKILHLEAVRLTNEAPRGKSVLGPGFLVGAAAVRYGLDKNCGKAELLAINDDDDTHAKLVKYYSKMGFKATYELTGEGWTEILDRVVWGGVGTRMDANCEELLRKWAKFLRPKSKQVGLDAGKGFSRTQTLDKVQKQK